MTTLKRILLVEDSPNDAELTMEALGKHNLANDVTWVRDGEQALDFLFCRAKYEGEECSDLVVILLDLKLPKVDGLEVLRTIKSDERLKTIPVVVLTSSREERDLVESYKLGVNAYVVKPVDFTEFINAVMKLGVFWALVNGASTGGRQTEDVQMNRQLRILHLEDDPKDAELIRATLEREEIDFAVQVVATQGDFVAALEQGGIDLILADSALPHFDGMSALAIVHERHPDLPFVFVSGKLGEEAAIESLKNGATDYVLKNKLSRLGPAVRRALTEAEERLELRMAEEELARANQEIRERAESYHNLFNSIRDVIAVTDHNRRIVHVNQPALREIFGYELEEIVGKSAKILYAAEEDYRRTGREIFDIRESVKEKLLELNFRRKSGEVFIGELFAHKRLNSNGLPTGNIGIIRDISERKRAEESLRESEMRRYQLQVELSFAAEIQAKLLPRSYPSIPGFDVAARCLPARQVGGDFIDWQEACPGVWGFTVGDVMGKGMAAAMLMATVRAAIRSVAHNRPAEALRLAELALTSDLENSESFVTLVHAQLFATARRLTFVDCGHGFAFLRRRSGTIEGLTPRGLPLGVPVPHVYQEGHVALEKGDILVLYSDGLIDSRPELALNNQSLAEHLGKAHSAQEMVDLLIGLTEQQGPLPDDITVLVARCTE